MKKTLLSAAAFAVAGVSAVAIMPTTSEAIPAFARQTGAACLSCHFQTFPAVNAFGRSFKLNAFTDVGEQALIEDEGLSLPSVMNASFVLRAQYSLSKVSTPAGPGAGGAAAFVAGTAASNVAIAKVVASGGSVAAASAAASAAFIAAQAAALAPVAAATVSSRTWNIPADAVLLMAGRVTPITGAFVEFNGGAANWQLLNSIDMDGLKVGLNIANTGFGPTAALEVSNVYGQHGGKLNGKAVSAVENIINSVGNTTSVAVWTGNDTFTVQGAMVAYADAAVAGAVSPNLVPLLRATYIADLGGTELMLGGGLTSGTFSVAGAAAGVDGKWIDVQLQGEMGDASYGIYADWVNTKSRSANAANTNIFTGGIGAAVDAKRDGFGIRAEIKPLHNVMFGIGYLSDKTTAAAVAPAAGVITKNTVTQFAATYEVFQNMELNAYYSSGDNKVGAASTKTKTYFAEVEALM